MEKKQLLKNKRGTAQDVLFVTIFLASLGIGFLIFHYVVNIAVDSMLTNTEINGSVSSVTALTATKQLSERLDYVVFGSFIAYNLGLIITSWFVAGYPIFIFAYFIIVVLSVIVAKILSEVWQFIVTTALSSSIASFPLTDSIMGHLPIYIAVVGMVGMVISFAKPYFGSGS